MRKETVPAYRATLLTLARMSDSEEQRIAAAGVLHDDPRGLDVAVWEVVAAYADMHYGWLKESGAPDAIIAFELENVLRVLEAEPDE